MVEFELVAVLDMGFDSRWTNAPSVLWLSPAVIDPSFGPLPADIPSKLKGSLAIVGPSKGGGAVEPSMGGGGMRLSELLLATAFASFQLLLDRRASASHRSGPSMSQHTDDNYGQGHLCGVPFSLSPDMVCCGLWACFFCCFASLGHCLGS